MTSEIAVHPFKVHRWKDYETLFGSAAIPRRCWCMWWRSTQREAHANAGEGNKARMRQRVESGEPVGLLAYIDATPVGWCSASPRDSFGRIARSPALTPVDGQEAPDGTWSTVCYFVHRKYRGRRVGRALLRAAVEYAREHGATISELSTDSRTGALALYEKVGMVVTSNWVHRAYKLR